VRDRDEAFGDTVAMAVAAPRGVWSRMRCAFRGSSPVATCMSTRQRLRRWECVWVWSRTGCAPTG